MKKLAISAFAVPAGKGGIRKWLLGGIACFEMRLTALLSMRKVLDDIEKFLILRKLRSSYLEGRNALIQPIVVFLTPSKSRIHASAASNFSSDCRALPEVTGSWVGAIERDALKWSTVSVHITNQLQTSYAKMDTVGTFEAKTHLTRLLDRVASGEQITITRHGTPIARLVPVKPTSSRQIRETIAKLKQFSKGQTLGGLKVKDLIEQGRR